MKGIYFGKTERGGDVYSYTLSNDFLKVEILNLGGIIRGVYLLEDEKKENLVLSYDDVRSYEISTTYFGAITGRVAGRIKNAVLKIGEKSYQLEKNDGNNNLHGGIKSLNSKVWDVIYYENNNEKQKLVLKYTSPHLENNFPATVDFEVSYTLNENNIIIEYLAVPDRETYINLTNHTYFNLTGNAKNNILNEKIYIEADDFIEVDKETIPTKISKVYGAFDLKAGKEFSDIFSSTDIQNTNVGNGIDHGFVLNKDKKIKCRCEDLENNRMLEIETDQPVVVMYTGNYLEGTPTLSGNIIPKKYYGFCLETQDYPDVYNIKQESMKIYSPDNHYTQKSIYRFKKLK